MTQQWRQYLVDEWLWYKERKKVAEFIKHLPEDEDREFVESLEEIHAKGGK